ncbi:hypothetical protein B0H66DRAFT_606019 [Apodospora peruviana]|uniref:Uncharacterized protein n=1 Tax=Apodospora peruviana TaxID=516989 RepID=A0AAE0M201_9PEZI|nr:hypothetical protein B0H66DRAFT_606019 [Apodospora peruviana]
MANNNHKPRSISSTSSINGSDEYFTSEMRDRQARGKDPYNSDEFSDDEDNMRAVEGAGAGGSDDMMTDYDDDDDTAASAARNAKLRLGCGRMEKEDFSKAERRQKAVAFLDSPELLMMYAQSTGDTLPAARLHFMKMLCGYDDPSQSTSGGASGSSSDRRSTTPQREPAPDKRRASGTVGRTR